MAVYKRGSYIPIYLNISQTIWFEICITEKQPFVTAFDCFRILIVFVKQWKVERKCILLLKILTVVNKPLADYLLITQSRKEASQKL